jgi:hypothetical protein
MAATLQLETCDAGSLPIFFLPKPGMKGSRIASFNLRGCFLSQKENG